MIKTPPSSPRFPRRQTTYRQALNPQPERRVYSDLINSWGEALTALGVLVPLCMVSLFSLGPLSLEGSHLLTPPHVKEPRPSPNHRHQLSFWENIPEHIQPSLPSRKHGATLHLHLRLRKSWRKPTAWETKADRETLPTTSHRRPARARALARTHTHTHIQAGADNSVNKVESVSKVLTSLL